MIPTLEILKGANFFTFARFSASMSGLYLFSNLKVQRQTCKHSSATRTLSNWNDFI